jgi:hypothetical protein
MTEPTVGVTVSGGHIQGIAGAGSVVIENLTFYEAGIFQAGLVDALERDFSQRYRRALHRSFFPEIKADEFYSLAQVILEGDRSTISASLRRRILLQAARSSAVRHKLELLECLLAAAILLEGPDSDLPAKARLSEARGQPDEAIQLLRDEHDPDSRSTLFERYCPFQGRRLGSCMARRPSICRSDKLWR